LKGKGNLALMGSSEEANHHHLTEEEEYQDFATAQGRQSWDGIEFGLIITIAIILL
jgi:hypothetical protein